MTSHTARRIAPLAAGLAALAVLAGAYALRGGGETPGGGGEPPPLRLTGALAVADGGFGGGRYVLDAKLPAGGPGELAVHRFGPDPVGDEVVGRLAGALGLDGSVSSDTDLRTVRSGDALLQVRAQAGSPWQFSDATTPGCVPDPPGGGGPDTAVGCVFRPGRDLPSEVSAPPSDAEALRLAEPVLVAAGLGTEQAEVTPVGPFVTVTVDPRVGDLPTVGVATSVTVGRSGVVSAQGWLGNTSVGATYPVTGAREAFRRLQAQPVPEMLMACPAVRPGRPEAPRCGGPLTVVGAEIGRSLQWEGERPLLVPSWLFDVSESTQDVAQVAVDPSYLEEPKPGPVPPGEPSTVPPATGGGEPGSTGAGSSGAAAGEVPVDSTSAWLFPDGQRLGLAVRGGPHDCGTRYRVHAVQRADEVVVRVLAVPPGPGAHTCELAEPVLRLDEPMAARHLVDGYDHEELSFATR